jgi:tetratricopeptide (TPR) repeat protein
MVYAASKYRKTSIWTGLLPTLLLNCILNITLPRLAPTARAQVTNLEHRSAQVSGAVLLDASNQPMSQVIVSLRSDSAGISRSVLTDYDGKFEVQGLTPGVYVIGVEELGYEPTTIRAELKEVVSKLVLRLRPAHHSAPARGSYTVSVAQLKIPEKARDEFKKGLERLAKNDTSGSLSHFNKAIQDYPAYPEAYYHVGVAQAKAGHGDEALGAFQRAIDLSDGSYPWAEFGVGFVLAKRGKLAEAEAIIRKGLEKDKESPEGHLVLGMTLLRMNRVEEAEQNAQEALMRKPNLAEAYLVLSDVYAWRGEYRAQLEVLDNYSKLEPNGTDNESVRHAREVALQNLAKSDSPH